MTKIFLIVSWALIGAVAGAMGLIGIASAVSPGPRGDIGTAFILLLTGVTLGAAGGAILGRMLQQKFAGNQRRLDQITGAPWIAGVILVPVMVIVGHLGEADNLKPDGSSASLTYQVRLPPGTPAPASTAVVVEFRTEKQTRKQHFPGHDVNVNRVGDRVVIQVSVLTYKTAERRVVRLRIGDGATHEFVLKLLPPRPPSGYAKAYSEWHGAEQIEETDKPPLPSENLEIRYLEIRYKMDIT